MWRDFGTGLYTFREGETGTGMTAFATAEEYAQLNEISNDAFVVQIAAPNYASMRRLKVEGALWIAITTAMTNQTTALPADLALHAYYDVVSGPVSERVVRSDATTWKASTYWPHQHVFKAQGVGSLRPIAIIPV